MELQEKGKSMIYSGSYVVLWRSGGKELSKSNLDYYRAAEIARDLVFSGSSMVRVIPEELTHAV